MLSTEGFNKVLDIGIEDQARNLEGEESIFEVIIEPDEDVYHAYCPILKGCRTWGHTEEEALKYIQEAVELYVIDLIADGKPIPGVGKVKNIRPMVKVIEIREVAI
jgi:predicted RNase H-like HicB family nuclease